MTINKEALNLGLIWTAITTTVTAVLFAFNTFATAEEVEREVGELKLDIWYGQYYDRLDDYDEALAEGNEELAREYERRLEQLAAKICKADPEWERC